MFPGMIELIAMIGGLVIPPAFDFIRKKFIKSENDTPERTAGTLATTKPEVLPGYVDGIAKLKDAETRFFNRDVSGVPSQWVINLRAAIRPVGTALCFIFLFADGYSYINLAEATRASFELVISSRFGSQITIRKG